MFSNNTGFSENFKVRGGSDINEMSEDALQYRMSRGFNVDYALNLEKLLSYPQWFVGSSLENNIMLCDSDAPRATKTFNQLIDLNITSTSPQGLLINFNSNFATAILYDLGTWSATTWNVYSGDLSSYSSMKVVLGMVSIKQQSINVISNVLGSLVDGVMVGTGFNVIQNASNLLSIAVPEKLKISDVNAQEGITATVLGSPNQKVIYQSSIFVNSDIFTGGTTVYNFFVPTFSRIMVTNMTAATSYTFTFNYVNSSGGVSTVGTATCAGGQTAIYLCLQPITQVLATAGANLVSVEMIDQTSSMAFFRISGGSSDRSYRLHMKVLAELQVKDVRETDIPQRTPTYVVDHNFLVETQKNSGMSIVPTSELKDRALTWMGLLKTIWPIIHKPVYKFGKLLLNKAEGVLDLIKPEEKKNKESAKMEICSWDGKTKRGPREFAMMKEKTKSKEYPVLDGIKYMWYPGLNPPTLYTDAEVDSNPYESDVPIKKKKILNDFDREILLLNNLIYVYIQYERTLEETLNKDNSIMFKEMAMMKFKKNLNMVSELPKRVVENIPESIPSMVLGPEFEELKKIDGLDCLTPDTNVKAANMMFVEKTDAERVCYQFFPTVQTDDENKISDGSVHTLLLTSTQVTKVLTTIDILHPLSFKVNKFCFNFIIDQQIKEDSEVSDYDHIKHVLYCLLLNRPDVKHYKENPVYFITHYGKSFEGLSYVAALLALVMGAPSGQMITGDFEPSIDKYAADMTAIPMANKILNAKRKTVQNLRGDAKVEFPIICCGLNDDGTMMTNLDPGVTDLLYLSSRTGFKNGTTFFSYTTFFEFLTLVTLRIKLKYPKTLLSLITLGGVGFSGQANSNKPFDLLELFMIYQMPGNFLNSNATTLKGIVSEILGAKPTLMVDTWRKKYRNPTQNNYIYSDKVKIGANIYYLKSLMDVLSNQNRDTALGKLYTLLLGYVLSRSSDAVGLCHIINSAISPHIPDIVKLLANKNGIRSDTMEPSLQIKNYLSEKLRQANFSASVFSNLLDLIISKSYRTDDLLAFRDCIKDKKNWQEPRQQNVDLIENINQNPHLEDDKLKEEKRSSSIQKLVRPNVKSKLNEANETYPIILNKEEAIKLISKELPLDKVDYEESNHYRTMYEVFLKIPKYSKVLEEVEKVSSQIGNKNKMFAEKLRDVHLLSYNGLIKLSPLVKEYIEGYQLSENLIEEAGKYDDYESKTGNIFDEEDFA